jgi:zinc transport system substrate-binding protein
MRAPLLTCLTALPLVLATPALADVPRVAVDIAPVHALVAQVMAGVGVPDLVLPPTASPHAYALRPSEAAALQGADLVVWIGPQLTPWLAGPLDTLSGNAARLGLLEVAGIRRLEFRQGASFEAHDHDDHEGHDDHAHDDHGDEAHDHAGHDHGHGHDAHKGHDHGHDHGAHDHAHEAQKQDDHAGHDHGHDHAGHDHGHDHAHDDHGHDDHDHDHSGTDPHAWLDPVNAAIWLDVIAAELSRLDPANAAAYAANAATGQAELATLQADIAARMAPLSGGFIVFHDAYHYFEARFGIEAAGAISLSDAAPPGPARVAEIRDLVARQGIGCVFVEPQFNRGMVDAVFDGAGVRIGVIDPIGATLEPGPGLYAALMDGMATSFEACLTPR